MTRLVLLAALFVAQLTSAQCNPPCPYSATGCCDLFIRAGGSVAPQRLFSSDCYFGNGVDGRTILTGLHQHGFVLVCEKNASFSHTCVFRIPNLAAGSSCLATNGPPQCRTGMLKSLDDGPGTFTIGADTHVNDINQAYCYYAWDTTSEAHGTFAYTGDGTTPRTVGIVPTTVTPTAAMVTCLDCTLGFGNNFYLRTQDMPTNQSFGWFNVSETGASTIDVRTFAVGGVVVGLDLNASGHQYAGAWWTDQTGYGATLKWTGNGNSVGGNCANAGDVQTVATSADPHAILAISYEGTGMPCPSRGGCKGVRSTAISHSLPPSAAGFIASDDFYIQSAPGDVDGGIGVLMMHAFDVQGGSTSETSCNSNTDSYYSYVTIAPAPALPAATPTP